MPSQTESFGLVALEAMASKVAVISSNSGGLPEVNIDGYTGFLSDVGDVEKMSEDMALLMKDKKMLLQFQLNAYKHAKSFDMPKVLPMYEEIYFNLCDKNPK